MTQIKDLKLNFKIAHFFFKPKIIQDENFLT